MEFSTDELAPTDRLIGYREGLRDAYFDLDVEPLSDGPLDACIRTDTVSTLHVGRIAGTAQNVLRPRELLRRSEFDGYFLNVQVRGVGVIDQCGRRIELAPGHAAFVHGASPFRFAFPDSFEQISLHVPHDFLPARMREPAALAAVGLPTEGVVPRMLVAVVHAVAEGSVPAADALTVEEQLVTLVHASLTRLGGRERAADARLLAWIERNLADPHVDLDRAARALGLSRRSIQYALHKSGESFSARVRRRRIERAQLLLRDPALARVPILEIALRVGFSDVSTFCRAFRRITGQTASSFRETPPP